MFPWGFPQFRQPSTPREVMLQRLKEGIPPELAVRAAGVTWDSIKDDPEVDKALAEGEIMLYERARDSGVTGIVRANMRYEAKTWAQKAEIPTDKTLEDYLRDD